MNVQVQAAADAGISTPIADAVRQVAVSVLNLEIQSHQIQDDTNIFELGADSMSIVELLFQLEAEFDLRFDESKLNVDIFKRFGDLVAFVDEQIKSRPQ